MIEIGITSNAQQIVEQLRGFPSAMLRAIARETDDQNQITVSHIQRAHLTGKGPYPPAQHRLGEISHHLRDTLWASKAQVTPSGVASSIGTNLRYASVHEYGFDGSITVREYTRRRFQTFHTSVTTIDRRGHLRKRKTDIELQTGASTVRSFQRHMRMPERAPIRTGIEERRDNYSASISRAILSAWNNPQP